ncbi:MAG: bacteriocin [Prolixibacteraceae bacterium]|jgi:bacteriocin-like protein|nr:bacteriocin [Prolixibacteraceae bacterium]
MKELNKNELMAVQGGGIKEYLLEKLADIFVNEIFDYVVSGDYSRDLARMPGAADAMMMSLH